MPIIAVRAPLRSISALVASSRAVDYEVDVARRDARLGERRGDALHDGLLRRPRRRQDLGGDKSAADLDGDVGEGAANIHADAHITRLCTHCYAFPIAAA